MEDPYSPPQSQTAAASLHLRNGLIRRGIHAARWYLFALSPAAVFGALSYFHAYRAAHMQAQGNLLLSPDEINASADLLLVSGLIISACMLSMVMINDLVSMLGKLVKKVVG